MSIARGTTPTLVLRFPADAGIDLTQAQEVYVSFAAKFGQAVLTKSGNDLDVAETEISVRLSQADSLLFSPGLLRIQANWTKSDGSRAASEIVEIDVSENLLDRVVE